MNAVAERTPAHAEHFALAQQALGFVTWIWNGSGDRAQYLGDLSPLLGLPAGSYSGRYADYQKALHPDDVLASLRTLRECISGARREYRTEERVVWPDGSVHWLETYGRGTSYGHDGRALALSGVVRDVTDRKRREEAQLQSERKFRAVFETSPEPVSITRMRDSRILELNEACAKLIGLPREALIGRPTTDLAPYAEPADRDHAMKMLADEGEVRNHMTRRVRPDGTLIDLLESCKTVELEGETCVVWSWRDVTPIRRAERALEELNASLEQRVQDRTSELEAANRELDSFSHSVSHDMRAPLFQINGFATLLRKDRASSLSPDAVRFLERIEHGTDQMGQLLESLLDLSRAGRATLQRSPVDMQSLVGEVLVMLRGPESARAELSIAELPQVRGDATLLRQVWQNLLGNALKFSRHAVAPRIEVGAEHGDGTIEFFVRDNGAGFDMKQAGKLFDVFERLHSDQEFEGTGAGLSIVKRIVERHGGRITAAGEPGRGACLRFTLPA